MLTEHTEVQWYEAQTGSHQGLIVAEGSGKNIAVTYDKQDAAHIVRCVNSHDQLVEALKMVLIASEDGGDMDDIDWAQIRAALLAAEGGAA